MNNHTTKAGISAAAGQLLAGSEKHWPDPKQTITVAGAAMTVAEAQDRLQTLVTNRGAVVTAQALAKEKVAAENAQLPALTGFLDSFVEAVRVNFGAHADVLTDFGLAAPKERTALTSEQKAVAAAKRTATRAARGTKGPKARKAVHGDVTAELVVKPVAQAAPAAPASPATPAVAPTPAGATTQQK